MHVRSANVHTCRGVGIAPQHNPPGPGGRADSCYLFRGMSEVVALCRLARAAARRLAPRDRCARDAALDAIAAGLRGRSADILAANASDLDDARSRGTSGALLDRLALDPGRVAQMAGAVAEVAGLADPLGHVLYESKRPNGVRVR